MGIELVELLTMVSQFLGCVVVGPVDESGYLDTAGKSFVVPFCDRAADFLPGCFRGVLFMFHFQSPFRKKFYASHPETH